MSIGRKIKELRTKLSLTQNELADRCDLTKGYISQIENDLTSPSINTLTDILTALGVNLKDFFNDDEEQIIYKKDDYFKKVRETESITWLVPNSQKNEMEPVLFTLEVGASTDIDMPHEGQEFGYVLKGKITVVYGNKQYICKEGETFYFTTDKNHYLINSGSKQAVIIWVTSPPNF
ncbi:MAG: helix-turn-helix transcriptional regulator [Bacilli bacterium]|nr:helix-turn-helix transcriptional regulator [Bacilli bacterium]